MKPMLVFTAGVFDMFHQGHARLFRIMRERADGGVPRSGTVLAIVHDDWSTFRNKGRFPVQNYEHRRANVLHFAAAVYEAKDQAPAEAIRKVLRNWGPSHRLLFVRGDAGEEFPGGQFPARAVLVEAGVEIEIVGRTPDVSSTQIRAAL